MKKIAEQLFVIRSDESAHIESGQAFLLQGGQRGLKAADKIGSAVFVPVKDFKL